MDVLTVSFSVGSCYILSVPTHLSFLVGLVMVRAVKRMRQWWAGLLAAMEDNR